MPCDAAAQEEDDRASDDAVSFNNLVPCAGNRTFCTNAANALLGVVPTLDKAVNNLALVADLIRKEHTRVRLQETYFQRGVAKQFHPRLNAFRGKAHKACWGTVAFVAAALLPPRPLSFSRSLLLSLTSSV